MTTFFPAKWFLTSKYSLMFVKRTKWSYDLDSLLVTLEQVQTRLWSDMWERSGDGSTQPCLQKNPKSSLDPYTDGAGTFRDTDKVETDYTMLNEVYGGTIFDRVIRDVNGVRARLMTKKMHSTYSVHSDKTPRYHLALITNPNAYFIFPTLNEIMHIPADGYVYEVDTTLPHSFANCGPDRTHLVISKGAHHDNEIQNIQN